MSICVRFAISSVVVAALSGAVVTGAVDAGAAARVVRGDCGTIDGRGCAPPSERVDLATPTFSNPTRVTNPLFPISELQSALLLGHVDGKAFRTETTLLPRTEVIAWRGQRVEVLLSQYMAYLDGRLEEVAIDRYAQADDGSVWYFGEDVFDYRGGSVAVTEGTWLAGREGPAAMIMPGNPRVGDSYRPENVPGIVFEEVTVDSIDETVAGPRGTVAGALVADELHVDGSHERKIFAPGYGEFRTGNDAGDLEAMALAVPIDALGGPVPPELTTLSTGSIAALESIRLGDWETAAATVARMEAASESLPGAAPRMVATRLDASLRAMRQHVSARNPRHAAQAAIDAAQSALDLELRHRSPTEVDAARLELWTQQLRVDAASNDRVAVAGDVAVLEWVRDRFAPTLELDARAEIDARLRDLRVASDAGNPDAAADHAARLGARVRSLVERQPVG